MNNNNDNEEHVAIVEQRQEYCHMVLLKVGGWGASCHKEVWQFLLCVKIILLSLNIEGISALEK